MRLNQSGYISLENGSLHYLKMGEGKRVLLAFHGYANNADLFYPFEKYLESDFSIISIDLPHHGESKWKDGLLLQKNDLIRIVQWAMSEYKVEKISLIGYSLGGRVCLTITELLPEKIDSVVLIASDGLVFNPLYYFVTKTFIGKKLFRRFLSKPKVYLDFFKWLNKKNLINRSKYKFAKYYLGSDADREFLLKVWPDMSLIVPDRRKLKKRIRQHHIPVFIFMGSYDKIIPLPNAYRFKKGLESVQLLTLEKGHRVFYAASMPQMADCLIKGKC